MGRSVKRAQKPTIDSAGCMRTATLIIGLMASACAVDGGSDTAELQGQDQGQTSSPLLGADLDAGHLFDVGICIGPLVPPGQPGAGTCDGAACSGTLIAP